MAETSVLPLVGRDRVVGYALLALAVLLVAGPFAWILMSSFKHQIAILTGAWSFTPTLSNYTEVLFGRRSDFAGNVANSAIVAATSTMLVLIVGTLAAYSLYRFAWARWVTTGFLGWTLVFHMIPALNPCRPRPVDGRNRRRRRRCGMSGRGARAPTRRSNSRSACRSRWSRLHPRGDQRRPRHRRNRSGD